MYRAIKSLFLPYIFTLLCLSSFYKSHRLHSCDDPHDNTTIKSQRHCFNIRIYRHEPMEQKCGRPELCRSALYWITSFGYPFMTFLSSQICVDCFVKLIKNIELEITPKTCTAYLTFHRNANRSGLNPATLLLHRLLHRHKTRSKPSASVVSL